MSKYLVIVESPTKAKTISGILGRDYEVLSSMGHIIDLPSKQLSIDIENNFEPQFKVIPGKKKVLSQLRKAAKDKSVIYLATDPDREGEAISWHIREALPYKDKTFYRVVFHEITKPALKEAFASPGELDMNRVNAQIARRVLDRIVGYNLSPLLWKKIVRGLSAGRVQSIALKFIVDREKEIRAFIPQTTYLVDARFKYGDTEFTARLNKFKEKDAIFETEDDALKCVEELNSQIFSVLDIISRDAKRKAPPPYTTSLLQQDSFNKLRFSSQKTMMLAQRLYEGYEIDGNSVGLITYMRTDSFYIAPKAVLEAKGYIENIFGKEYLPLKDNKFKEKKGAQRAHEAIRPTGVDRLAENLSSILDDNESRLYSLIWRRFIASFMKEAIMRYNKAVIGNDIAQFIAEGKSIVFDGFLKVLGRDEELTDLPGFSKGDSLEFLGFDVKEKTTKPPARYNDASLVRILEEKGIGRPSTYAPIIATLVRRDYMRRERSAFTATDLGIKVSDMLADHFADVINEDFTVNMEESLDEVAEGDKKWTDVLNGFYKQFIHDLDEAKTKIKKDVELSDKICPQCGKPMAIKWSRKGRFLSCSDFPNCKYAESITTGVKCPSCNDGLLIQRRNKRGQFFYGCSKYPECTFTSRALLSEETKKDDDKSENDDIK